MIQLRATALLAIGLGLAWSAPAARAAAAGECQCSLSVISGVTGMTMTAGAVRGPCGRAMSGQKVVAAQTNALHAAAAAPSAVASVISSPEEQAAVGTTNVTVNSNFFTAQTINVTAGDTVKWTVASGFHTVTSDTPGMFDSGGMGSPSTFSFTFNAPGTYGYHCTFHGGNGTGMFGTVNVAAAPEPFAAAVFLPIAVLALRRRRIA